jgi:ankyrin repeat protein
MPTVRFLIREKVNLDKIDLTGASPLYHAIKRGHEDIAKLLHYKGASVHAPPEKLGSLLCICGQKGDLKRVKLFKECDADIEASDYDLRTVAHLAAAEGQWELIKYLASHTKFNFNLTDRWGKTPFDELSNHKLRNELEELIKLRHLHIHPPEKKPKHFLDGDAITEDTLKESQSDNDEDETREEGKIIAKMLQVPNRTN